MIPVNEPVISAKSIQYVNDALKSGWISSAGKYIDLFEEAFASYIGTKHAITTTNGTTALHLAVAVLNIEKGDEVIMPDLTIISCPFAVIYSGATPVFVDIDPRTGNIDPGKIEEKITKKTKAIMVVHLYGHPVQMSEIMAIARKYNLFVIEDAAEAHGAEVKYKQYRHSGKPKAHPESYGDPGQARMTDWYWQKVGSIGEIGCFSFFANKIVTTGEGGMIVTNSDELAARARRLKDLSHSSNRRFLHEELGYNYRMTNLQAALGFGELENIDKYIQKKRWMAKTYHTLLSKLDCINLPTEESYAKSIYWMYAITVNNRAKMGKDQLRSELKKRGIDTRDFFIPLHLQPVLTKMGLGLGDYPISEKLSEKGIYLPSGLAITEEQIKTVCVCLEQILS